MSSDNMIYLIDLNESFPQQFDFFFEGGAGCVPGNQLLMPESADRSVPILPSLKLPRLAGHMKQEKKVKTCFQSQTQSHRVENVMEETLL